MKTQSNVGARCPYPREGNGFADPMKIQILSLTPRFSEVWCPLRNLNGFNFNRLLTCRSLLFKKTPFFKAFQRLSKERFLRTYSVQIHAGPGESKPVKPSPTKSNHTPPLKTCETKSDQIRVNPINFFPAMSLLPTSPNGK